MKRWQVALAAFILTLILAGGGYSLWACGDLDGDGIPNYLDRYPGKIDRMMGKIKIPDNGCYLGAYIGDFPTIQQVREFENMIGKDLAIIHLFMAWGDNSRFPTKELDVYVKNGKVPMISWRPVFWDPIKQETLQIVALQDIISHKHDSYIRRWAEDARSFAYPLFLRFGWEMNHDVWRHNGPNSFGPYGNLTWKEVDNLTKYYGDPNRADGPERYVDAWKHIHSIFKQTGASNVIWVWSPNYESWPTKDWNDVENYYPGDQYVDWLGLSLYNWGYPIWESFDFNFRKAGISMHARHPTLPMMLAEWGSGEQGGDKAIWIREAFDSIRTQYPYIKASVWFNKYVPDDPDYRDWRVDSSSESLEAYRRAISDPYFLERILFVT